MGKVRQKWGVGLLGKQKYAQVFPCPLNTTQPCWLRLGLCGGQKLEHEVPCAALALKNIFVDLIPCIFAISLYS